jgi:hypothetical protein
MGCSRVLAVLAGMAFASAPGAAEDKREPKLASLTDAQLKEGISARAGRNYAWMGYNTPEIHLQLPAADNSAYAEVTFEPPKLLDKSGKAVAYEVEHGLYDAETHRNEVRFVPKDAKPDSPPVEFARAVGTIKVRYPVAGRTVVVKPGAAPVAAGAARVSATPTSLIVEAPAGWKMLEAPFGSGMEEPLRVYDAAGKRLEEDGSQRLMQGREDGGQKTTHVFKGKVAQVKLDVIDEWAEVDLAYDLPPMAKLPAGGAGTTPAGGDEGGPTIKPTAVRRVK